MVGEMQADGTYQRRNLDVALRHVRGSAIAIDGGAHIGAWSRLLAARFAVVHAFEPSPDTFACLEYNLAARSITNVVCHACALGASPSTATMALDAENAARANTGARHVVVGGEIAVVTIDSLALPELDFLKLDIEGSEFAALQGARETLRRCRPVVLVENKHLWTRHFGLPAGCVEELLTRERYRCVERVSCDEIWRPR